jgi:hypothetical protein
MDLTLLALLSSLIRPLSFSPLSSSALSFWSALSLVCVHAPPRPQADVFTWWQQPPHLHNQAALETLRDFMLQGQIRPTAVAAMLFDAKYGRDASDYRIYRKYAVGENAWADTVRVDEAELCCARMRLRPGCGGLCGRARGTFFTLGVPLMALANVTNHTFRM